MKKVLTLMQPFDKNQNIIVYENGNKIDYATATVDDTPQTILNLIKQYGCETVEFVGAKKFAQGIGNKLQELELTEFNKNVVDIKYI